MITRTTRLLLVVASLLLAAGAAVHALAFRIALPVVDASGLPRFYLGSFKSLWLLDSITQLVVTAILAAILLKQLPPSRGLLWLLAVIPVATGAMLYAFLGPFAPEYVFLITAVLLVAAGWRVPPYRAASLSQ